MICISLPYNNNNNIFHVLHLLEVYTCVHKGKQDFDNLYCCLILKLWLINNIVYFTYYCIMQNLISLSCLCQSTRHGPLVLEKKKNQILWCEIVKAFENKETELELDSLNGASHPQNQSTNPIQALSPLFSNTFTISHHSTYATTSTLRMTPARNNSDPQRLSNYQFHPRTERAVANTGRRPLFPSRWSLRLELSSSLCSRGKHSRNFLKTFKTQLFRISYPVVELC